MDRALNYSGERIKKDPVSVSAFTRRFRLEERSIHARKKYVVSKYSDSCGTWPKANNFHVQDL